MNMKWFRRLFRRKTEPIAQIVIHPKPADEPKRKYRYDIQSETYCDVLRALARMNEPVTAACLRHVLEASTVGVILSQMRQDGIVSIERVTVGSRIASYRLTEIGRVLAATLEQKP